MSLLPLMNDLWLDDYRRPRLSDMYDQHFGLGLLNNESLTPVANYLLNPLRTGYLRPWRNVNVAESGVSSIQSDKNEFRVNLDVQQFKPEELKVKIADGFIIVEGKHEERSDQHGFVSRQFVRRYKVPEDVEDSSIASSLSSDGVLTLRAPKKGVAITEGREIPITTTNQPAVAPKSEKIEGSPQ
ncbi:protein lethal(2)essential for life isoform X2 [Halyomorpha halys]|nr:protein lethal(2)essential for life-like isoform X2 [Halyomorpha halys]